MDETNTRILKCRLTVCCIVERVPPFPPPPFFLENNFKYKWEEFQILACGLQTLHSFCLNDKIPEKKGKRKWKT